MLDIFNISNEVGFWLSKQKAFCNNCFLLYDMLRFYAVMSKADCKTVLRVKCSKLIFRNTFI